MWGAKIFFFQNLKFLIFYLYDFEKSLIAYLYLILSIYHHKINKQFFYYRKWEKLFIAVPVPEGTLFNLNTYKYIYWGEFVYIILKIYTEIITLFHGMSL